MKRCVLRVVVVLAVVLSTLGCVCGGIGFGGVRGSGRVEEEERLVRGFTGVELATFGDLDIRLGDEEGLRIEAEDNLLPYFETEVRNGILKISSRPGVTLRNRRAVNFYWNWTRSGYPAAETSMLPTWRTGSSPCASAARATWRWKIWTPMGLK
jgi:hypothetical protein